MRHWNKLLALLLAMVMALGMTVTAFAEENPSAENGSPAAASDTDKKDDDATSADGENKDGTTAPADGENKDGATTPADGENKDDATTPADGENKDDATTPADGENKDGDTTPADGEDKKEDAPAAMNYTDVTEQNWFYDAVAFVTENKLMDGMTDTTFGPSEKMTRQMLAVALYRLAGSPEVTVENPFTDVADDAAYKNAVVWAYSVGVVTGVTDTTFAPDSTIQRQAIATMLARYIQADLSADSVDLTFTDADAVQNYAKGAISWAVQNELLKGNPDGTVDPRGDATRSAVATMLQRFAPLAEGKAPTATPAGDDETTAPEDTTPAADTTTPADEADKKDDADTADTGAADKQEDTTPASGDNTDKKEDATADDNNTTTSTDKAEDNKE